MKRLTTTILLTIALIFQGVIALAQIDKAKMERDLRVASGVLASLMNTDSDYFFGEDRTAGTYVEGFGIIFKVEDKPVFRYNKKVGYVISRDEKREESRVYREQQRANQSVSTVGGSVDSTVMTATFKIDASDKELAELMGKAEKKENDFSKKLRESFEIFLVDYSQLVGQLKASDKILLVTDGGTSFVFSGRNYGTIEDTKSSRLSAEMLVGDHRDFNAGKLTRTKLIAKIKFVENSKMERKPDLELFGNMLKTTYNSKYTETYFMSSVPTYEILNGLGVIYSMKVYSSYSEDQLYRMPGNKKSGLTKEERNQAVEAMYPAFVDSFKENMVRYGSTIKSLKEGEKLMVKIKMTTCETCSFANTIEFMVDKSVLDQFSSGGLTLAKAKEKVKLK